MAISFKRNAAVFAEVAGCEEAEALLEWLARHPKGKIDLSACTHLHAANLQVLMAAGRGIDKFPADQALAAWLESTLKRG